MSRSRKFALVGVLPLAAASLWMSGSPAGAGFPGDNGLIAYSLESDNGSHIATMNNDGTGSNQLTSIRWDREPNWSADGKKIAFGSAAIESPNQIYVMNADGSDLHNVSNNSYDEVSPAWSPDGSKIVFVRGVDDNGGDDLYVMNADGTGVVQLTNTPGVDENNPVWSPDGTKIAFGGYSYSEGMYAIWVVDPSGGTPTAIFTGENLPDNPSGFIGDPDWSPDSSRIVFSVDGRLRIMNADGTNVSVLVSTNAPTDDFSDRDPAWSPDGKLIAFARYTEGPTSIFVMSVSGGTATRLTHPRIDSSGPNWQPLRPPTPTTSTSSTTVMPTTTSTRPAQHAAVPVRPTFAG